MPQRPLGSPLPNLERETPARSTVAGASSSLRSSAPRQHCKTVPPCKPQSNHNLFSDSFLLFPCQHDITKSCYFHCSNCWRIQIATTTVIPHYWPAGLLSPTNSDPAPAACAVLRVLPHSPLPTAPWEPSLCSAAALVDASDPTCSKTTSNAAYHFLLLP